MPLFTAVNFPARFIPKTAVILPFNVPKPLENPPLPLDTFVRVAPVRMGAIQTKADLERLYKSWQLSIEGHHLVLVKEGVKTIIQSHPDPLVLKEIMTLFKPPKVVAYEAKQGTNGDCHLLATLQEMMITGKHIDALIRAVSIEIDPNNKHNNRYNITLWDENKQPQTYGYTLNTLLKLRGEGLPNEDLKLPVSGSHQPLVTLLSLALRPFTAKTGFNNFSDAMLPEERLDLHAPFWSDAGLAGKLLRALDPNAAVYCVRSDGQDEPLAWCKEPSFRAWLPYDANVNSFQRMARFIKNNKLVAHTPFSFAQLQALFAEQSSANLLGLVISENNKQHISPALLARGFMANHAYTLLETDPATQTVSVLNPHNSGQPLVLQGGSNEGLLFTHASVASRPPVKAGLILAPHP